MDVQLRNSLGIDLGTSSVKVGLYDSGYNAIDSETENYDVHFIGYGGAEQSPSDWWNSILNACGHIEERNEQEWKNIASLGVVGQFSGTVPMNKDGIPLMDAIIWLDSRGEEVTREVISGFPSVSGYGLSKLYRWIRLTGGAPTRSGKDSISHILYIKEKYPDVYRTAFKFLEPKDYINYMLTGKYFGTYDSTVLNWATDNRDLAKIDYDSKLLRIMGINRDKFPDLTGSWKSIGRISSKAANVLHLPEEVTIAGGAGDIQSTIIGSGCTGMYDPLVYIGTSSWITLHVPFKKTDLSHNIASLPGAAPGSYFVAAEQESAGSAMNYVRNLLFDGSNLPSFSEMDAIAAQASPGSNGLVFIPWLYGERAPVEDRNLRASFYNLSMTHDRASLIRSVMEGVGYNLKWLLDIVEKFAGRKFRRIRMSGGGASSSLWPQILSDILNREIAVIQDPVLVNARGAAILSGVALEGNGSFSSIPVIVEKRLFTPDNSHSAVHERNFSTFLKFYNNNRKHMDALNGSREK